MSASRTQTDRRVWRVYPTQRMQELLPHVRLVMREWNEYLLEEFERGSSSEQSGCRRWSSLPAAGTDCGERKSEGEVSASR